MSTNNIESRLKTLELDYPIHTLPLSAQRNLDQLWERAQAQLAARTSEQVKKDEKIDAAIIAKLGTMPEPGPDRNRARREWIEKYCQLSFRLKEQIPEGMNERIFVEN